MKRIENILILPILVLMFLDQFSTGTNIDIHFHDTYYVVNSVWLIQLPGILLLATLVVYRFTRRKHGNVPNNWVMIQFTLTLALIALSISNIQSKVIPICALFAVQLCFLFLSLRRLLQPLKNHP